jgi:hypothetical protein
MYRRQAMVTLYVLWVVLCTGCPPVTTFGPFIDYQYNMSATMALSNLSVPFTKTNCQAFAAINAQRWALYKLPRGTRYTTICVPASSKST